MSLSFHVNPEYASISEIVPGLFICGVSALTPDEMKKNKITHIINATHEVQIIIDSILHIQFNFITIFMNRHNRMKRINDQIL